MVVESCPSRDELESFLLGQAEEARQQSLEAHLLGCAACTKKLETLAAQDAITTALRSSDSRLPRSAVLEKLIVRLKAAPSSDDSRPEVESTHLESASAKSFTASRTIPTDAAWLLEILTPPDHPDALGCLGPYRVHKLLGKGGMGAVLLAEDPRLERRVALKVLLPEIATRPEMKERFLREARLAAKIEHDHIVGIYQVGEDRGIPFIAMQFLKGAPLDEWLKARRKQNPGSPVPPATILKLGREIALGLAAAHKVGLIHRDIKPANIWLDASAKGRVKILDFGLARAAGGGPNDHHLTQTGTVMGTPAYMAPEQARGTDIDHRADLFSLGGVLYMLCTGQLPFKGTDTMSILTSLAVDTPDLPSQVNSTIPPSLCGLVMKLLQKKPDERFQTADEVVKAIQSLERSSARTEFVVAPTAQPQPSPSLSEPAPDPWSSIDGPTEPDAVVPKPAPARRPPAPPKAGGSRKWIAAAAGALLLLVAGVVFFLPAKDGTLRVEIDDPEIEVSIQGTNVVLKKADRGQDVKVEPGEKTIKVTRGDFSFETDKLILKRGENAIVRVDWLPGKVQIVQDGKVIAEKPVAKAVALVKPKENEPAPKSNDSVVPPSNSTDRVRDLAKRILNLDCRFYCTVNDGPWFEVGKIEELPKGPFRIVRVGLAGPKVAALKDDPFQKLDLTGVGWVDLNTSTMTDAGLLNFTKVPGIDNITDLSLSVNFTDAGLAHLAKFPSLRALTISGLDAKLNGTGFQALQTCEKIGTLTLPYSSFTPEGVAAIGKLPGLTSLNLDGTKLTPKHLDGLAGTKLTQLYVSSTELTDEGIERIARIESLVALSVINNKLTGKSLESLKQSKSLAELNLVANPGLKEAEVKAFAEAMPKVKITSDFGTFGPK